MPTEAELPLDCLVTAAAI